MANQLDENVQNLIDAMQKVINSATGKNTTGYRAKSSSSSRGSGSSGSNSALQSLDGKAKDLSESMTTLADTIDAFSGTLKYSSRENARSNTATSSYTAMVELMSAQLKSSTGLAAKMNKSLRDVDEDIVTQSRIIKQYSGAADSLTSETAKASANASVLGASMLSSHSAIRRGSIQYYGMIDKLTKSAAPLNSGLLRSAGIIDESTGAFKKNLDADAFADLHTTIGSLNAQMKEDLSKFNLAGFSDILTKSGGNIEAIFANGANTELRSAVIGLAAKFEKAGVDLDLSLPNGKKFSTVDSSGGIDDGAIRTLTTDSKLFAAALESLSKVTDDNQQVMRSFTSTAVKANDSFLAAITNFRNFGDFLGTQIDKYGATANVFNSLSKAGRALGRVFEEVASFNIAGVPASFFETQAASVKLGLSFQETVKLMQENKRLMAIYGDDTGAQLNKLNGTFKAFGYSAQQSSELIGPMSELAQVTGVNVRNGDAFNGFVKQTMTSFSKIRGVVDISAGEYAKANAQLLSSANMQATMLGMDQARAQEYAKDTIALRDHYLTMNLSTEQANELLKTQQAQQRAPVLERVRQGAQAATLASMVGFNSKDSMRMYQLAQKGNRNANEQAEFTDLSKRLGQAAEQKRVSAYDQSDAQGMAYDAALERLMPTGELGSLIQQSQQMNVTERNGTDMSKDPAAVAAANAKAAGNSTVAGASDVINSISSALKNSLTTATIASASALIALTAAAAKAAITLNTLGGGGGFGGLGDGGGKGGKMSPRRTAARQRLRSRTAIGRALNAGENLVGRATGAASRAGSAVMKATGGTGKLLGGLAKGAGKVAGVGGKLLGKAAFPIAAGLTLWDTYSDYKSANSDIDSKLASGQIDKATADRMRAKSKGAIAGRAGGTLAGGALGAAIGTAILPGIGTYAGGALGSMAGGWLGEKAGGAIANWWSSDSKAQPVKLTGRAAPDARRSNAITPLPIPGSTISVTPGGVLPGGISVPDMGQATDASGTQINTPGTSQDGAPATPPTTDPTALLQQIVTNTAGATELLQAMLNFMNQSQPGGTGRPGTAGTINRQIATTQSFITGRQLSSR
jgi:hypothetical protein